MEAEMDSVLSSMADAVGKEAFQKIRARLKEKLSYPPVIVFMGKTGAGKSSTCNAVFGQTAFRESPVDVGTRECQVEIVDEKLTIVDVPGLGEGGKYSEEYRNLYRKILTNGVIDRRTGKSFKIDAIIWLIKSGDRALQVDHDFYKDVFVRDDDSGLSDTSRLIFAISQADAMEPIDPDEQGSWDRSHGRPGTAQAANLDKKRRQIADLFGIESNLVIEFSSKKRYNLDRLLERVISTLPNEKVPLTVEIAKGNDERVKAAPSEKAVSPAIEQKAEETLWQVIRGVVIEYAPMAWKAIEAYLPPVIKLVSKGLRKLIKWL